MAPLFVHYVTKILFENSSWQTKQAYHYVLLTIPRLLLFFVRETTVAPSAPCVPFTALALDITSEDAAHQAHSTEEDKRGHRDDDKHDQDEQVMQGRREHLVMFFFLGRCIRIRRWLSGRRGSLQTQENILTFCSALKQILEVTSKVMWTQEGGCKRTGSKFSTERHLVALLINLHLEFTGVSNNDCVLGFVAGPLGDILYRTSEITPQLGQQLLIPISLTTSMPLITFPKTTWRPSSQLVMTVVIN